MEEKKKNPICFYCAKQIKKWQNYMPSVWKNMPAHVKCFEKEITTGRVCNTCRKGKDGLIYIFCIAPERAHIQPRCYGGLPQSTNFSCNHHKKGLVIMKLKKQTEEEKAMQKIRWDER